MRPTGIACRLLVLAIVLLGNCVGIEIRASIPNGSAPRPAGESLDEAAVSCLDWSWSVERTREVAGGVLFDDEGNLVCSPLTLGTRSSVEFHMDPSWLVQFHTHVGPSRPSHRDKRTVAHLDPLGRPGYVREPSGAVWVYECLAREHGRECRERRIERAPVPESRRVFDRPRSSFREFHQSLLGDSSDGVCSRAPTVPGCDALP